MPEGFFFEQKRTSPASLAIVIALHGAALGALLLAKGPVVEWVKRTPTEIIFIPEPLPPEPKVQPEPEPNPAPPRHRSHIDAVPPIVPTPPRGPVVDYVPLPPAPLDLTPPGNLTIPDPPRADPVPPPVRVDAEVDPRYLRELQPPYPAAEERASREGTVRIRVTIGANGRVKAAERVSATNDAFWRATERQALSRWRFRPATVDGRPVESTKTMTVHFRMDGR